MSSLFDTEDDLSLRTRRGGDDRARERSVDMEDRSPADREVTLNTGTVLALFFGLALLCAMFFGFGYSMGRKSTQTPAGTASADSSADSAPVSSSVSNKPAPGSPAGQPVVPNYVPQASSAADTAKSTQSIQPIPSTAPSAIRTSVPEPEPPPARAVAVPATHAPSAAKTTTAAAAPAVSSAPAAAGEVYVQIAAVSHQEDADVLRSALGRRGYKVVERGDGNDKLIHVQIGPFADRKSAEATRQKLLSDGYNAFLK